MRTGRGGSSQGCDPQVTTMGSGDTVAEERCGQQRTPFRITPSRGLRSRGLGILPSLCAGRETPGKGLAGGSGKG